MKLFKPSHFGDAGDGYAFCTLTAEQAAEEAQEVFDQWLDRQDQITYCRAIGQWSKDLKTKCPECVTYHLITSEVIFTSEERKRA